MILIKKFDKVEIKLLQGIYQETRFQENLHIFKT